MREVAFIKQNKQKWLEIEQVISRNSKKNPDELSSLYINLINDLSFAQTYYPKSKVTSYLNHLSVSIYQKIYKTKRTERNRLKDFFLEEVPLIAYEHRRYLLFAFMVFAIFTTIGAVSAHYDVDFVRLILGDSYVDMTLENIAAGNPLAVYDQGSTLGTSIAIMFNNLKVGLYLFISGVFAGFGTLFILMQNSIMLGSFQYFFQQQAVLGQSMRGIWIHGAFEISAMIIEAMAGFILGASILFPKTYSRLNSFKIGFKNAFKIMLSTIPFTIVAGFLEGFVTRHALEMPIILNLIIILGTFGFIVFYYVLYPVKVHQKYQRNAIL
ncbi:stage II sporulation protein M [Flavobacteriaceae bacterium Ap0902]|nr:stage II sporulation protein M [Flavobacteriaceae bacterium Ap0902]